MYIIEIPDGTELFINDINCVAVVDGKEFSCDVCVLSGKLSCEHFACCSGERHDCKEIHFENVI